MKPKLTTAKPVVNVPTPSVAVKFNMSIFLNTVFTITIIVFLYACYNSYKARQIINNNNIT